MITDNIKSWINKNVHFLSGVEISREALSYIPKEQKNLVIQRYLLDRLETPIKRKMKITELEHPLKISERYEGEVYIFNQEELKELLELHEKEIKKGETNEVS